MATTCIACEQTVPASTERLHFFAQRALLPRDDDAGEWSDQVQGLIQHLDAVFSAMLENPSLGEDVKDGLILLGGELTTELGRRLEKLRDALPEVHEREQKAE